MTIIELNIPDGYICTTCKEDVLVTNGVWHHKFLGSHTVPGVIPVAKVKGFCRLGDKEYEKDFTIEINTSLDHEEIANLIDDKVGDWVYDILEWGWSR